MCAIGSKRTMDAFGAGAARPADNHEKLKNTVRDFVLAPTTQPWGNRAIMFRDPDGNLINYFTPVGPESIKIRRVIEWGPATEVFTDQVSPPRRIMIITAVAIGTASPTA